MLRGNTQEDIKAIFRHTKDAETLLLTISYTTPLVIKDLQDVTSKAKVQHLGSTGCVTFYCHNYVAPQHKDHNVLWNFSFTEWGVYIRNVDNTTYYRWFDSSDIHRTIMPGNRVLQSQGEYLSIGVIMTVRKKDQQQATKIWNMHQRAQKLTFASAFGAAGV
ncbi:hypothetical protein EV424DRAFT_1533554 [Suillus variegatus]|nr:hypothetical protein EV424DRAFT_1533554 [Suillus variegatus]